MTVGEFEKLLEKRDREADRAEKFRQQSNATDPGGPWRYRLVGRLDRQASTRAWEADQTIRRQPEWQIVSDHCVATGGEFTHAAFHRVIAPFSVQGILIREKTLSELVEMLNGTEKPKPENERQATGSPNLDTPVDVEREDASRRVSRSEAEVIAATRYSELVAAVNNKSAWAKIIGCHRTTVGKLTAWTRAQSEWGRKARGSRPRLRRTDQSILEATETRPPNVTPEQWETIRRIAETAGMDDPDCPE